MLQCHVLDGRRARIHQSLGEGLCASSQTAMIATAKYSCAFPHSKFGFSANLWRQEGISNRPRSHCGPVDEIPSIFEQAEEKPRNSPPVSQAHRPPTNGDAIQSLPCHQGERPCEGGNISLKKHSVNKDNNSWVDSPCAFSGLPSPVSANQ